MTPVEMFNELVRLGYVVPGSIEPSRLKEPTAYISVPTVLAFASPPVEDVRSLTDTQSSDKGTAALADILFDLEETVDEA
jgi:hypothetical protein